MKKILTVFLVTTVVSLTAHFFPNINIESFAYTPAPQKSKVINEMTKEILGEYKGYEPCPLENKTDCKSLSCKDCIKKYFYKKVEEEDNV